MKCTTLRGRIVLAAAAAAALAACGDDTTGDTDGGTDSSTSSTTTSPTGTTSTTTAGTTSSTTGTTTTDGSSSSDAGTSDGSTSDGGSSTGGGSTGGSTGDGTTTGDETTGGVQDSLTPAEVCPFALKAYDTELPPPAHPDDQSVFAGPRFFHETSNPLVLFEGTAGADQMNVSSYDNTDLPCVVAGDGDDLIEIEYSEGSGVGFLTVSGGQGADTFAYRFGGVAPSYPDLLVGRIVDFEPGEDRIWIDTASLQEVDLDTPVLEQSFGNASTLPGQTSIIIDAEDGEIWLAGTTGETFGEGTMQLVQFEPGTPVTASDVVLGTTLPGCVNIIGQDPILDLRNFSGVVVDPSTPFVGEISADTSAGMIVYGSQNLDAIRFLNVDGPVTPPNACIASSDGDDIPRIQQNSSVVNATNTVLSGGAGADTFAFSVDFATTFSASEPSGLNRYTISDFEVGVDELAFDVSAFNVGEVGEANLSFMSYAGGSGMGNSIIIDTADGEVWVTDDTAGTVLITLTGNPVLTASDVSFVVGG